MANRVLFARNGYFGDPYYTNVSSWMNQTFSQFDWHYYEQQWNNWQQSATNQGYGDPISQFFGENVIQPFAGDYLLSTGDTSNIDWSNAATLPYRWIGGFVVDQVQELRQAAFDAGTRYVFIQSLKLRGEFEEAARQESALLLGILVESQYSPLAPWMKLASLVSGAVYQFTGDEELAGQFDIRGRLETLGKSLSAGAFALGIHPVTVAKGMARHRTQGTAGLATRPTPGRPSFLSPAQDQ